MAAPVFTALATSTRHLYLLLRCIAFTTRADVYITDNGLRFATEESHAVQASTELRKELFSSYLLQNAEDNQPLPPFQINIVALLETLQIFGVVENTSSKNSNGGLSMAYSGAFNTPALGVGGTCKITYAEIGAPLSITIEESGVKTTCSMNTYELPNHHNEGNEIPFDIKHLQIKAIMPSSALHDAVTELASTDSEVLVVSASSQSQPYFMLEGQGGPFGDSNVDFAPESKPDPMSSVYRSHKQPHITELFAVSAPSGSHGRVKQRYRFDLVKRAGRAMALAAKVSFRVDVQGVLRFQFMVESPESASTDDFSFVEFLFVPLLDSDDEDEHDDDDGHDEDNSQSDH